jgi:hypothetical protein
MIIEATQEITEEITLDADKKAVTLRQSVKLVTDYGELVTTGHIPHFASGQTPAVLLWGGRVFVRDLRRCHDVVAIYIEAFAVALVDADRSVGTASVASESERLCKGSMAIGTGCGKCLRCLAEKATLEGGLNA